MRGGLFRRCLENQQRSTPGDEIFESAGDRAWEPQAGARELLKAAVGRCRGLVIGVPAAVAVSRPFSKLLQSQIAAGIGIGKLLYEPTELGK